MLPYRISEAWVEPEETTRFVLFVLGGVALGYLLHATGRFRGTKTAVLLSMAVRLVLVVAVLSRRFRSATGLGLLLGAISTRVVLVQRGTRASEMPVEE